jgi:hypothetical protein
MPVPLQRSIAQFITERRKYFFLPCVRDSLFAQLGHQHADKVSHVLRNICGQVVPWSFFLFRDSTSFHGEKRRELAATQATNYQHSTKHNAAIIEALSKVKKGANFIFFRGLLASDKMTDLKFFQSHVHRNVCCPNRLLAWNFHVSV